MDWAEFRNALITAFEPVTETEEARKQLRALRQTGRVSGYIQCFQELQCRLPGMNEAEAFSAFLVGLAPHLQEDVAAHVRGDLEVAKAMAMRMDMFHTGGEGSGKQRKNENQKKKGAVQAIEGQKKGEPSKVHAVQGQNKGKGQGKGKKKKEQGPVKC